MKSHILAGRSGKRKNMHIARFENYSLFIIINIYQNNVNLTMGLFEVFKYLTECKKIKIQSSTFTHGFEI